MERDELISLVEKYRATAFRIAYNYTGCFEEAEDISQDVFLKLFKAEKKFKDEEHVKAWLIKVTMNASKSFLRSSWKKRRDEFSTSPPEDVPYYSDVSARELFDLVMKLPVKYRTAVYLFYYEDYPIEKVARLMQISKSAVATRLSRARDTLKKAYMKGEGFDEREYQENVR